MQNIKTLPPIKDITTLNEKKTYWLPAALHTCLIDIAMLAEIPYIFDINEKENINYPTAIKILTNLIDNGVYPSTDDLKTAINTMYPIDIALNENDVMEILKYAINKTTDLHKFVIENRAIVITE